MSAQRTQPYKVLLVDEHRVLPSRASALFSGRTLVRSGDGATPMEMLDAVLDGRPDVIVLDLEAGAPALQAIQDVMAERPTPILVLKPVDGGADPFRALALGALDVAELPSHPTAAFWSELAPRVALLANVRVVQHVSGKRRRRDRPSSTEPEAPFPVVAIAASLGGPKALAQLISMLPKDLAAPLCVCQHISDGFTGGLANWLASESGHPVVEARNDELLDPGRVYVAPSGLHFLVERTGRIRLDASPPLQGFRPSCDALLESVGNSFGRRAIGVILTGMGKDGARGLRVIRDRGGRTVAQDEASCVVYGMPREAVALNAAMAVLPLNEIPATLLRWVDEC